MLYLDANVFLAAAQDQTPTGNKARQLLSSAAGGKEKCITSALTWDEIFWTVKKKLGNEKALEQCQKLLNLAGVNLAAADLEVITMAQSLCAKYAIDPRDSIHAATAIQHNCEAIISTDPDFDKIKEIKHKQL